MDLRKCPNCGQPLPHKPGHSDECKRAVRREQNRRSYEKHREAILSKRRNNPHADVRYQHKKKWFDKTPVEPENERHARFIDETKNIENELIKTEVVLRLFRRGIRAHIRGQRDVAEATRIAMDRLSTTDSDIPAVKL